MQERYERYETYEDAQQTHEDFDANELEAVLNEFKLNVNAFYAKVPGFFTPYKSFSDVALTVSAPITGTFALALLTAISAAVAALATAVCLGSLIVAGGAALFRNNELASNALGLAALSGIIAGVTTLITPILAALTVLNPIPTIAAIFTRAGASVTSAISNCSSSEEELDEYDDINLSPTI